jgi:hypothetical protein
VQLSNEYHIEWAHLQPLHYCTECPFYPANCSPSRQVERDINILCFLYLPFMFQKVHMLKTEDFGGPLCRVGLMLALGLENKSYPEQSG